MTHVSPLLLALFVVSALCLALAARLLACLRGRAGLAEQLKTMMTTEKSAVRQLRLGSHNLRSVGMSLQGHAESLQAGGTPDVSGIAEAATAVFEIADYMHEWAIHAQATQVLNEEAVHLGNALDEAVSTIKLTMQPGRRRWLVEPDVLAVRLRADRRALRHVLTRALSIAVRGSGHDAGIRLRLDNAEDEVALVIERQPGPAGEANPSAAAGSPDLRLTLARALMEAHGGKFSVERCDGSGVRLRLTFPIGRILTRGAGAVEPGTVPAAPLELDHRLEDALLT